MSNLGFHCHGLDHLESVIVQNELVRGEFYNFPPDQLPELKREIEQHNIAFSVHAPLVQTPWYVNPPTLSFLCDVDEERRNLSFRMIHETMTVASDFGAEYVIAHFPTPATDANGTGYARLREIAREGALRLEELSEKNNLPVHIEGFGPSPFLSVDFLAEVIAGSPHLRYCFDIGHMHIASKRDGFDLYQFTQQMTPYIGSIHIWNSRGVDDYWNFRHIPVHPSQRPEEGWADIDRLLRLILTENPSCPIVFESGPRYPEALGKHDFRDGVKWIKEIVSTLS
ncbi:sugar phosphate isomerase/epimerase family protein [Chloroflexota bacterium]